MASPPDRRTSRPLGLGRGAVYPADAAGALVTPLRGLLHPPRRLVRRLQPAPDAHVLEVGPGPGWFSRALADALPRGRLHLLDVQAQMLERARARVGRPVAATVGDACRLPFGDSTFDAVVATAVLGETPDPARAVAELRRVVRPGGMVLVLETRTDPDFVPHARLLAWAADAGLVPTRRHGRLLGYTMLLGRPRTRTPSRDGR